jgi:hypothetical protein
MLPVAVKEEMAVAGWHKTMGSLLWDEVPDAHHPVVDKLLAAGLAPLCGVYGYKPPFADEVVFRVAYHHAKRSAVDLHTRTFPTLQV